MYPVHLHPDLIQCQQRCCFWYERLLHCVPRICFLLHHTRQEYGGPTTVDAKYTSPECHASMTYTYWYIAQAQT